MLRSKLIGGPSGHDRDMIGLYTDTQFLKLWGDSQNTVLPRKRTCSELSQPVLCLLSSLLPSVTPFPHHHHRRILEETSLSARSVIDHFQWQIHLNQFAQYWRALTSLPRTSTESIDLSWLLMGRNYTRAFWTTSCSIQRLGPWSS